MTKQEAKGMGDTEEGDTEEEDVPQVRTAKC